MSILPSNAAAKLIRALLEAYMEEQEDQLHGLPTSEPDGFLGLGVDPRADIVSTYIKPHLSGYDEYLQDESVAYPSSETEARLLSFEERAYGVLTDYEVTVKNMIIIHVKSLIKTYS